MNDIYHTQTKRQESQNRTCLSYFHSLFLHLHLLLLLLISSSLPLPTTTTTATPIIPTIATPSPVRPSQPQPQPQQRRSPSLSSSSQPQQRARQTQQQQPQPQPQPQPQTPTAPPPRRKKPINAFFIYSKIRRAEIRRMDPFADNYDILRHIAADWRLLSPSEKTTYEQIARETNRARDSAATP